MCQLYRKSGGSFGQSHVWNGEGGEGLHLSHGF